MNPSRPLRLLFIGNAASVHTQRWVNWFAVHHTVALLSIPPITQRPAGLDVSVDLIPASFQTALPIISLVRAWLALRLTVARWKPDIVHAHLLVPNAWLAAASGSRLFVTTAWGSDVLRVAGWRKYLNQWATRHATLNTGDSQELLDKLRGYGCRQDQLALVQWGVDTDLFHPGPLNMDFAKNLGLPVGRPIVLGPRILQSLYNIETIVKAFIRLAARRPEPILVISRYGADPAYEAVVKSLIAPIKDRVFFISAIPYPSMPELYRLANIVISVPSSDSTSVTLLESMASGNSIIATNLPSTKEWITDGRNGFLVPPGDVDRLVEAMVQALDLSPEARQKLAQVNRETVRLKASEDAEMNSMEQRYLSLVTT